MGSAQDLAIRIGQILMRNAQATSQDWDYCGYMFETADGVSSTGEIFMFSQGKRLPFRLGRDMKEITNAFKDLRQATLVPGDDPWIKCLAVLRNDGDFQTKFEFDDIKRWSIVPDNVERAYEILVSDVYPEILG
ncbi:MAG: hypothetical protein JJ901_03490 [Erythrobacter sp.]|uniref:hypothetical protein n=1 Tax=Erythrobacter sp. TaxID=1042 RepID=UPI001AFF0019|nr:hypothetical protein [Erythrobacter sp.]MBO6767353.1 hypothetical protein [Erythrobacter sp.]